MSMSSNSDTSSDSEESSSDDSESKMTEEEMLARLQGMMKKQRKKEKKKKKKKKAGKESKAKKAKKKSSKKEAVEPPTKKKSKKKKSRKSASSSHAESDDNVTSEKEEKPKSVNVASANDSVSEAKTDSDESYYKPEEQEIETKPTAKLKSKKKYSEQEDQKTQEISSQPVFENVLEEVKKDYATTKEYADKDNSNFGIFEPGYNLVESLKKLYNPGDNFVLRNDISLRKHDVSLDEDVKKFVYHPEVSKSLKDHVAVAVAITEIHVRNKIPLFMNENDCNVTNAIFRVMCKFEIVLVCCNLISRFQFHANCLFCYNFIQAITYRHVPIECIARVAV